MKKPKPVAKRKTPRKTRTKADTLGSVWRGYERSLKLGAFTDAGRTPAISDVEVVVCFADVRGFTRYVHNLQKDGQDHKVHNFLSDYFAIYPKAILRAVWDTEPEFLGEEITDIDACVRRLVVPTSYKNLGDGMMIIWELQNTPDMRARGLASRKIFQAIHYIAEEFKGLTTVSGDLEMDSYSKHAEDLKMGFGIARGHAWRLDFGHHVPMDYAGSIVNLASRLQSLARPEGIVAQLGFSESLLRDIQKNGDGSISRIPAPKGLGTDPIDVWHSGTVVIDKSEIKEIKKTA